MGHTFFYDVSGSRPWRPSDSMSSYWAEEDLCYRFAEEMLMPRVEMKRVAGDLSPRMDNFLRVKESFAVSTEALCRRIARLNLWRCILLVLVTEPNTSGLSWKAVCKHDCYKNLGFRWSTLLARGSIAYLALDDPGVVKALTIGGPQLFSRGGQRIQWRIESVGLPTSVSGRVVMMITAVQAESVP
ncbi:MAG: hypothetical protein HY671_12300 [Chloroflexi bacterium]|nr:hypothetical protein [Chloroflexota bacterium]